jgi:hypothetical protein
MFPAGLEPTISVGERPQTYALERAATGTSYKLIFIHLVVCLTTDPKPLPKRALHIVRSRASSFK